MSLPEKRLRLLEDEGESRIANHGMRDTFTCLD